MMNTGYNRLQYGVQFCSLSHFLMSAIYLVGPNAESATERVLEALWRVSEPYDEQAGIFVPLFVIVE